VVQEYSAIVLVEKDGGLRQGRVLDLLINENKLTFKSYEFRFGWASFFGSGLGNFILADRSPEING